MIILGCTPLGQVGILGRRVWSAALAFHTLCCLGRAFVHAHGLRLLTFALALASALALALDLALYLALALALALAFGFPFSLCCPGLAF